MKKIISTIFMIIFFCLLVYSGYKIVVWYIDNSTNKTIQKDTKKSVKKKKDKIEVDFDTLKEQNPDTVAYLKVNGTSIDYVVVKGENNSYYLSHNFNKRSNISGWIFMDYRNKLDVTDRNVIIYGHDTKDGSMFGTLINILDKSWYTNKDNLTIDLVTINGNYKYKVFSVYEIVKEDYYLMTDFVKEEDYSNFLNTLTKRSIYDFKEEVSVDNSILTLSTCKDDGKNRVVLHAKLME